MDYDLIVAGCGVAGLTAALESDGLKVLIVTKTSVTASGSSPLAQGGVAASVGEDDSPLLHYEDTVKAGNGSCSSEAVQYLTEMGADAVSRLEALEMPFDRHENGTLEVGREGAHSRRRILKAGGDATGRLMVDTLSREAAKRENIHWKKNFFIKELLIEEGHIQGVFGYDRDEGWCTIRSPRVLLATGGAGQIFGHTTNPSESTGDGLAIALKGGIELADMEMVQFHPTALNHNAGDHLHLLTEALRGDGAFLITEEGKPFMENYSPLKDLAPRDVVSRAIWSEMEKGHCVYLDMRSVPDLERKFPTVCTLCRDAGINPLKEPAPVTPGVHYFMGGVWSEGNLPKGLGAAGETACRGIHGANRLASNSLLDCLVFGKSEVQRLADNPAEEKDITCTPEGFTACLTPEQAGSYRSDLQNIMYRYGGIIRRASDLKEGLRRVQKLQKELLAIPMRASEPGDYDSIVKWEELSNMVQVGEVILKAALEREESRGAHYREDFPEKDPSWEKVHRIGR